MPGYNVTLGGDSRAVVGNIRINYFGDEFVETSSIPIPSLDACRDGRFVPPKGDWGLAAEKLETYHTLILVAEAGSGRRTAALKALAWFCSPDKIMEVQCSWKRLRTAILPPPTRGCGYLLDLTESTGLLAEDNFIGKLMELVRQHGIFLVISALESEWSYRLAEGNGHAILRLSSPDARRVTESELRACGRADRLGILGQDNFSRVWESSPKTDDACRLARIIARQPFLSIDDIIYEYESWRVWIDKNLPAGLPSRSLMWSCAFCDGGQKESILKMSDDLRRETGESRTPSDALSEKPSSMRFAEAKIEPDSEQARFPPGKRGLASAIRHHLWAEYADQRDVLTEWICKQIDKLPSDDAELVAASAISLAIERRDDSLLRTFRDAAAGRCPQLGVSALSAAAIDPQTGPHVRYQLYRWLDSSSPEIIDLVSSVCGADFGQKMPGSALVRLRWAAQKSAPGSGPVINTINSIASHHPDLVLDAIDGWLRQPSQKSAGINTFLALAARSAGAKILCGVSSESDLIPREQLGACFREALSRPESRDFALSVMRSWKKFADQGELDQATAIQVTGLAVAPWVQDNLVRFLFPHEDSSDMNSYNGRVLKIAIEAPAARP
jgi:hypothetical protein